MNITGNIFDIDGSNIIAPADIIDGIPNNININTNSLVIVRKISGDGENVDLTEVNEKLDNQSLKLFNIENRIVSIENINGQILDVLSNPIQSTLVSSQENLLIDIFNRVSDMWKLNGLSTHQVIINKDGRVVDNINQKFTKNGDQLKVDRI